ncbi:MAG: hypothetical protein J6334_06725, partial [Kiritimatiellae bacterium]|nr:hypothetical protein [Kiritimatiellia bacterium]
MGMPYVWLSLILLECSFWMPSVRMGEDFRDARKRYIRTLIGDPLFYVGIVVLILMIVEGINGGCTLKYLTDTDKWVMEDPSQPWLPFAVHVSDAFYWLTVFLAVFTVMLVARNALGSTARRYLLRTVALFSGLCAIGASIYALRLPVADSTAWFASQTGQTIGVVFLLWALVGLAVFADNEGRSGRHGFWFFAIGAFGNFFGMLIFAEPVVMTVGAVAFILVLIFSLTSLHKVVEQGDLLKYIVVGVIFIGAIGGSLFYASKDNPVTRKVKTFKDFESYAATYTSTRPERAKAAIAIFQGHPLCGVGVEGYGEFVGFFVKSDAEWKAFKV